MQSVYPKEIEATNQQKSVELHYAVGGDNGKNGEYYIFLSGKKQKTNAAGSNDSKIFYSPSSRRVKE
jgi:hypothetical protein